MRVQFCRGLRFEILANLTAVLLFALVLTGLGVWFINGKEMIKWNMVQGRALFQSLQEEIVANGGSDGSPCVVLNQDNINRIKCIMDKYRQRNDWLQLVLVDERLRVRACTGICPGGSAIQDPMLSLAISEKRLCSEIEGKHGTLGFPDVVKLAAPLIENDRLFGGIAGHLSLKDIVESTKRTQKFIFVYVGLVTLVVLIFGTILLSRIIVHPLERMNMVVDKIGVGDLNQVVTVSGKDEIGSLADAFNRMTENLKQHQRALQGHVKALRRVNQQLKQSQDEVLQSEKLASIGLLAAGVAHEIGNPLSSILGYVGIIQQGTQNPEEQKDYIHRIEKETLRIHTILKGLREFSIPSSQERKCGNVNELIQNTIQMIAPQQEFKEMQFKTLLEPDLPSVVLDENQFQQVLVNLFLNAKDAMGGKGVAQVISRRAAYQSPQDNVEKEAHRRRDDPPGIDFHLLRRSNSPTKERFVNGQSLIEVIVKDSGGGISKENIGKVFNPFFTTKETGKGTGLGLAICKRIIESFNGDIKIEREPAKGCIVTMLLPVEESN